MINNLRGTWRLCCIFFLSGFAGMGYEMIWTRVFATGLGHEIVSVLAVVAAFFCGSALGAWSLHGVILKNRWPDRVYAALEMVIGVWTYALAGLIPWANKFACLLMGTDPGPLEHWAVSFLLPLLLLLPATFAMGATLPAMESLLSRLCRNSRWVGGLYAANTFGAVAGCLVTTFVLVPQWGFRHTLFLLMILNLVCATSVLVGLPEYDRDGKPLPVIAAHDGCPSGARLLVSLFVTGLLGIGYEVLAVRVMSQVLENTVFSFAALLSCYLLGTALGAALYQRQRPRRGFDAALAQLLAATSAACLLGMLVLKYSEPVYRTVRQLAGAGFIGSVCGEMGLALTVFLVPAAAMGATFSHLAQTVRGRDGDLGRAVCLNTLGAAFAPFFFGVVLLPLLGSKIALIVTAAAYLSLLPSFRRSQVFPAAVPAALALILCLSPFQLRHVTLYPGDEVVDYVEGVMATVAVVKDTHDDYHLKVNDHFQMGGTSSYYSDRREGILPLLLHPHPRRVLFLGVGTGATIAGVADYPGLEADGVELIPEVVPLMPRFEKSTGDLGRCTRVHIRVADARRFVIASRKSYDVIVADLFHPARDGAGSLYTVEHFRAIRARLNPGGLFCQWLPIYQLDLETLRVIVRTFLHVFPHGSAYLADYSLTSPILALVSCPDHALRYPFDWFEKRVRNPVLLRQMELLRLDSLYSVLGCYAASATDLEAFAGRGAWNTDDRPIVTFMAPRVVYSELEPAPVRLLQLIDRFHPRPEEVLQPAKTERERRVYKRLAAYWSARNSFLHAGLGIPETNDVRELVRTTREKLLSIVRTSPDFSAAYNPLLAMARGLYDIDRDASRRLLQDLEAANPHRDDAGIILQRFFAKSNRS